MPVKLLALTIARQIHSNTYHGTPCKNCTGTLKYTNNRTCCLCADSTKKRCNKIRWSKLMANPSFRIKQAEKSRTYRRTPKGKEVNRVGQIKVRAKRIKAEGSHTTQEWIDIKAKYGDRCLCCGRHESELKSILEEDHVIPLSRGGTNWIDNIQPLCEDCNGMGGKGTKTTDYRSVKKTWRQNYQY